MMGVQHERGLTVQIGNDDPLLTGRVDSLKERISPFPKDGIPLWRSTIQAKLTSLMSIETISISRIGRRSGPRV